MITGRNVVAYASVLLILTLMAAPGVHGQVYDMRTLNTEQIRALNLERTVVIMSAGVLEQHGPYLPSYTDGYVSEFIVQRIGEAVVARPG